jgi:hypothetical protein
MTLEMSGAIIALLRNKGCPIRFGKEIFDEFEFRIELPNYWKEDSIKENFTCPVCGNPPCLCSAVIYGMNIA